MTGYPVEQDADALRLQRIDQHRKVRRRAEAACRGEQACRLIAPRSVKRMLHHRQQLDMSEAHIGSIGGKLLRQLAIRKPILAVLAFLSPGAEMDLVDRNRRVE